MFGAQLTSCNCVCDDSERDIEMRKYRVLQGQTGTWRNSAESPTIVENSPPPKECLAEVGRERGGTKSICRAVRASIFGVFTDGSGTGELSLLLIGRLIGKAQAEPLSEATGASRS